MNITNKIDVKNKINNIFKIYQLLDHNSKYYLNVTDNYSYFLDFFFVFLLILY